MFTPFITALTQKIISFLKEHPDFFEKRTHEPALAESFKIYLKKVSEKEFMEDLALVVRYAHHPKSAEIKGNALFRAVLEFLTTELARKIDYLDGEFYLLPDKSRREIVEKLLNSSSPLAEALKDILLNYTYQHIAQAIRTLGTQVADTPYILVQSPQALDTELKRTIRTELLQKYPLSYPTFQLNHKLIGGIRIFENGTTTDHSWLARVLRFTSLTTA